jgi:hypothetical protein
MPKHSQQTCREMQAAVLLHLEQRHNRDVEAIRADVTKAFRKAIEELGQGKTDQEYAERYIEILFKDTFAN